MSVVFLPCKKSLVLLFLRITDLTPTMKRKRSSEDVKNTDDKEKEKGKAQEPPQHEVKREKLSDSKDDKGKEKIKKEENEDEPGGLSIAEEAAAHRQAPPEGTSCPYLDTIDRTLLDFDFEKVCSVSSVNVNIYCCLVCGRYFQGRGRSSHAYFHSLAADHHVFINLHNEKVVIPSMFSYPS
jgi:U4/U6.U5 tri-snRNP-associated protein 2